MIFYTKRLFKIVGPCFLVVLYHTSSLSAGEVIDDFSNTKGSDFESAFLDTNVAISNWFNEMADGLDLFLAGERYTDKKNETSAKIEGAVLSKEFEEPSSTGSFNVNLRLPNIEEYWNLKFSSYDDTKEKRAADKSRTKKSQRERDYGASVGLFQRVGQVRTAFQPRVSFTNSLKLSHSLSFESILDGKTYQVNPKLEFYGNSDVGTGIFTAFNIFFPISKKWSLTFINDADYISRTHLLSTSNGLSFRNGLSEKTAMSYGLIFDSNNQPNFHLESYAFSLSWYQMIYKNILDYSITPFVEFPKTRNFKSVLGLTLSASLNF
jgi:hypothetical protein